MSSPSVFLPLSVVDSVQVSYLLLYGVRISRMEVSTHTELLNKIESKTFRLIDSPLLTECLQRLTLGRNVAYLAIFYRSFHVNCSSELANCMPPLFPRSHSTRFSVRSHLYSVHPPYARVNQYLHSFFPSTGKLWNSLPESVFPPSYELNSFKRGVPRHLQPKFGCFPIA